MTIVNIDEIDDAWLEARIAKRKFKPRNLEAPITYALQDTLGMVVYPHRFRPDYDHGTITLLVSNYSFHAADLRRILRLKFVKGGVEYKFHSMYALTLSPSEDDPYPIPLHELNYTTKDKK